MLLLLINTIFIFVAIIIVAAVTALKELAVLLRLIIPTFLFGVLPMSQIAFKLDYWGT